MPYLSQLLAQDEDVLIHKRQHEAILLSNCLVNLMLANVIVGHLWLSSTTTGQAFLDRLLPSLPAALNSLLHQVIALICLVLLLCLVYRTIMDVARWSTTHYILTTRRVVKLSGIFNKQALDSSLTKINDVQINQSWLARLLGYGTINILTAAEDADNRLSYMLDPMLFKQALNEARHSIDAQGYGSTETIEPDAPVASTEEFVSLPPSSILESMSQLKQLHEQGFISDDELQQRRQQLLMQLTSVAHT